MILKYAKNIINEESIALKKLSASLNNKFLEAVKIISTIKGNKIITGVGKSGFIAKKNSFYYDIHWNSSNFYTSNRG